MKFFVKSVEFVIFQGVILESIVIRDYWILTSLISSQIVAYVDGSQRTNPGMIEREKRRKAA